MRARLLPLLALALVACGGDDDTALEPTLSAIQSKTFDLSCSSSSCHSTQGMAGGLLLEAGTSHGALVGVDPQNADAVADGLKLVDPGNPDSSFLVIKLRASVDAKYGDPMPFQGFELPADQVQQIEDWIRAGAPND